MAEQISGAAIAALEYRQRVLARKHVTYDYGQVFMNSAWTIGLVGLGWVALKLGFMVANIPSVSDVGKQMGTEPYVIDMAQYKKLYDYVEGGHRWVPMWMIPDPVFSRLVGTYRRDPNADPMVLDYQSWNELKAAMAEEHPGEVSVAGDVVDPPVIKVLKVADSVFARYGPVLPACILGLNIVGEKVRVRKLEKELVMRSGELSGV